jgi:hypothetical protein
MGMVFQAVPIRHILLKVMPTSSTDATNSPDPHLLIYIQKNSFDPTTNLLYNWGMEFIPIYYFCENDFRTDHDPPAWQVRLHVSFRH